MFCFLLQHWALHVLFKVSAKFLSWLNLVILGDHARDLLINRAKNVTPIMDKVLKVRRLLLVLCNRARFWNFDLEIALRLGIEDLAVVPDTDDLADFWPASCSYRWDSTWPGLAKPSLEIFDHHVLALVNGEELLKLSHLGFPSFYKLLVVLFKFLKLRLLQVKLMLNFVTAHK